MSYDRLHAGKDIVMSNVYAVLA